MIPLFFVSLSLLVARRRLAPWLAHSSMSIYTSLSESKVPGGTNIDVSDWFILVCQPHGPYPRLSDPREKRLSSLLPTSGNEELAAEISRQMSFVTRGLAGGTST